MRMKKHWLAGISHDQATRLYKQHSARGFNAGEPYHLPMETPTVLCQPTEVHPNEHNYARHELLEAIRLVSENAYRAVGAMSPGKGGVPFVRS
jgi:hypothetical protein